VSWLVELNKKIVLLSTKQNLLDVNLVIQVVKVEGVENNTILFSLEGCLKDTPRLFTRFNIKK